MQFSEREIVVMYKEAKDKRAQIGILASLNDCRQQDIKEILIRNRMILPRKKTVPKAIETVSLPVEVHNRESVPDAVAAVLYKRLDELDEQIKELSREYIAISNYLKGNMIQKEA